MAGEHFAYSRSLVGRQERGEGLDEVIVGQIPQFLAAAFGELDAGTRELVRMAERHTVLDKPFGDVGGQREAGRGFLFQAVAVEVPGLDHAGEGGQQHFERIDLVEHGLLVLLQVASVGGGQALQGGQQTGQIADESAGLAAGELGDIRVLLLRHDGGAGGIAVVELDEGELLGVPDDDLLGQAGDVHAGHGGHEREFGHEITCGGAVDGVVGHAGEAELTRHGLRVEAERVAGQCAGAVRRGVDALVPVDQSLHVANQRPSVGHELVREQHGLGVLHVGAARHHGAAGLFALLDQGVDEVKQESGNRTGVAAQPHTNQAGDLVVAGASGTQFAAEFVAGNVNQSAFEGGGLVLIVFDGGEGAVIHMTLERVERILHALQLVGGQKSRTAESTGVGAGTGDIVVGQAPVELRGLGQSGQFRRRTGRKATTPQGQMFVVLSHEGSLKSENSCV